MREFSGALIRALIPSWAPPSWPNHLPKAPPSNIVTKLGIRISMCEFWGNKKHSVHSTVRFLSIGKSGLLMVVSTAAAGPAVCEFGIE